MEKRKLGNTKIEVSRLCFGGLTVGPLQANLPIKEGANVIAEAFQRGVNFIDTAELYETYPYITEALRSFRREDIVISSKSYAYDIKTAKKAVESALKELNTDYIDVFMMHEQESEHTIRGHYEALEYYLKMKEKGYIRSVGLSTHHIAGVKAATKYNEIEVLHPIINKSGLGIQDGNVDQMILAIKEFHDGGGGVFGMKPLGGGNLLPSIDECFDFVLNLKELDSIAIGMQRIEEVISNVSRFEGKAVPKEISDMLKGKRRRLHIDTWCMGCSACEKRCGMKAIKVIDGQAVVDMNKCVLCGYCSTVCPEFCIKVV